LQVQWLDTVMTCLNKGAVEKIVWWVLTELLRLRLLMFMNKNNLLRGKGTRNAQFMPRQAGKCTFRLLEIQLVEPKGYWSLSGKYQKSIEYILGSA
jgi:hypothetical protein